MAYSKIYKGSGANRKELHVVKLWTQATGEALYMDEEGNYRMFGENNELVSDKEYGHLCIQPANSHDRLLFDQWFTDLYGSTEKSRQRAEAEAEARANVRYKRQKGSYKPSTCKKFKEIQQSWFNGAEIPDWWNTGKKGAVQIQIGATKYTRCEEEEKK